MTSSGSGQRRAVTVCGFCQGAPCICKRARRMTAVDGTVLRVQHHDEDSTLWFGEQAVRLTTSDARALAALLERP